MNPTRFCRRYRKLFCWFIVAGFVIQLVRKSVGTLAQRKHEEIHTAREKIRLAVVSNESAIIEKLFGTNNTTLPGDRESIWFKAAQRQSNQMLLKLRLPQLQGLQYISEPSVLITTNRTGVPLVIGIPTVKRSPEMYLHDTLQSLVENMDAFEKTLTLIVVMIAEPNDPEFVRNVTSSIQALYPEELLEGLIEVMAPARQFYPNFTAYKDTTNRYQDQPARFKWRVKQNLDYAYLMLHCISRGHYYLQLEDDVLTSDGYISTMLSYLLESNHSECTTLQYSNQGFIGKLFHSKDLPQLAAFTLLFYEDKPVDWIFEDFLQIIKNFDKKTCSFKENLFIHIGKFSTLNKKTHKMSMKEKLKAQKVLKDRHVAVTHINPKATCKTTLSTYRKYFLSRAYLGATFFWGVYPKAGDYIQFEFDPPANISSYLFLSGDVEHSDDIIKNATVEACFLTTPDPQSVVQLVKAGSGCWLMGSFNTDGVCSGSIPQQYGPLSSLFIRFHSTSPNWIVLNEIILKSPSDEV